MSDTSGLPEIGKTIEIDSKFLALRNTGRALPQIKLVRGLDNEPLSINSLPEKGLKWNAHRVATIVAMVEGGLICEEEVCSGYDIEPATFQVWREATKSGGYAALYELFPKEIRRPKATLPIDPRDDIPVEIGDMVVYEARGEVVVREKRYRAKQRPLRVLKILARRLGETVERQTLIEGLYKLGQHPNDRCIDAFIYELRNLLASVSKHVRVKTVVGAGYKLRIFESPLA